MVYSELQGVISNLFLRFRSIKGSFCSIVSKLGLRLKNLKYQKFGFLEGELVLIEN